MISENMLKMSVLVTGGAGFIGSHIVEYLLKHNVKFVRILDNLSTGSLRNVDPLLTAFPNVEFMWGDLTNLETCRRACRDVTVICHQGALGAVPRSVEDPLTSHNVNVNGFLNILLVARENNIKRVVYASSSSVYGDNTDEKKEEEHVGRQMSPYATTKYVDELYAGIFTRLYGLECVGLRYFNVFGPRQNPNGVYSAVIPRFIRIMQEGRSPMIHGDGSATRDFTYVDNVVHANYLAITTVNEQCFGEVFNVGTDNSVSINELITTIREITGHQGPDPLYGLPRPGDVPHSRASIDKISSKMGYQVLVDFREGLRRTIKYFSE